MKRTKFCLLASLALLAACSTSPEPEALLETQSTTTTLRIPLTKASDDAEELARGSVSTGGGLLDFNAKDGVSQTVGVRFQNVAVPQGAKITRVRLEVVGGRADADPVRLRVSGEAAADAATFTSSQHNLSSREKTAATSLWRPNLWEKGELYKTGDLSAIVQEVVNRKDWKSGNALAFFIGGVGGTGKRSAVTYETNAKHRPVLVVSFDTGETAPEPTPEPEPDPTPEPEPEPVTPEPEPVTPSDPGNVSSSQREWHQRLLATIDNPRYNSSSLDPKKLAATGDLYRYGRDLATNLTAVMLAYRETGDRDLVRHIDKIMNIARGKLRDTNGDGYKNWQYLTDTDASSRPYLNTDYHVMDEMMTHGFVASMAYTLKQAGYSSSARFWTDYLENDFEAKWRKRSGKHSGFPFIDHKLMHPTTNFIRYHYYMYKLTGDSSYYSEAKRLAGKVRSTMRSSGSGYVWDHKVGDRSDCQPMVYVKYTTQALADLSTASSSLFDSSFMKRVAYTMARKALRSSSGSLASNICGSGSYGSVYTFAQHPFAQLAPWDSSGRLETAAERVYAATERHNTSSPKTSNLAAIMVFTKGR